MQYFKHSAFRIQSASIVYVVSPVASPASCNYRKRAQRTNALDDNASTHIYKHVELIFTCHVKNDKVG